MTQILINDLEFCESSSLPQEQVQGGASFFDFSSDFTGAFDFSPDGSVAAGSGAAVAVAIGDNSEVFTFTTDG